MVEFGNDITKEITIEKRLAQTQRIEAIGVLAGGIAHDFNNILAGIIGFAEMAAEEEDPESRRNYIGKVLKASDRAKDLIGQILTFSRRTPREMKPIELKTIVRETMKLLRQTLPSTIELRQEFTDLPCAIIADPTQIHQVLMNLGTNAKQALGERGGRIVVGLSRNDRWDAGGLPAQEAPDSGPRVLLTVSDNGPGIDPSLIDRIFEPFFTTKTAGEGTGLGLSVVYGIVKNHGGRIDVASQPGEGTTFRIQFPLASGEEAPEPGLALPAATGGTERILFVDDEPTMVELGTRMLSSLGYAVTAHLDSTEALAAFQENPDGFDLLITDMTMPRLTGQDLARRIMTLKPEMPVVLCTGYNEYVSPDQAAEMGIRAFVLKPYNRREIARVIREALGGQAPPAA
jgi:nitrogen-specific signal transduction histidine kinase/ActR/RegA family two-component response regulator